MTNIAKNISDKGVEKDEYATNILLDSLKELDKTPDKEGNYPHIHVSFSENGLLYIYRCPVVRNMYILYERRDLNSHFSYTRHMTSDALKSYITYSLDEIKYISIAEKATNYDTMRELYECS